MLLLQTIASSLDFRNPLANERRMECFHRLLAVARDGKVDCVLLPGGFWTVPRFTDLNPFSEEVITAAEEAGILLITGIDVLQERASKTGLDVSLPFFGIAGGQCGDDRLARQCWQQTSSTRDNAWDVPEDDVPGADRVVEIGRFEIGVLICGELFSQRARTSLAARPTDLIVDLGHSGMGQGLQSAMAKLAEQCRSPVAHSQHVRWWDGPSLHYCTPDREQQPRLVSTCEYVGDDEFWIAHSIRDVPERAVGSSEKSL